MRINKIQEKFHKKISRMKSTTKSKTLEKEFYENYIE